VIESSPPAGTVIAMELPIRPNRHRHVKPAVTLAIVLGLFVLCGGWDTSPSRWSADGTDGDGPCPRSGPGHADGAERGGGFEDGRHTASSTDGGAKLTAHSHQVTSKSGSASRTDSKSSNPVMDTP
jgi:hypothetical protein